MPPTPNLQSDSDRRTLAIVDDSVLARGLIARYVQHEPLINSVIVCATISEASAAQLNFSPDCAIISVRYAIAENPQHLQRLAIAWPTTFAIFVCCAGLTESLLAKCFGSRFEALGLSEMSRASESAGTVLDTLKRRLSTLPVQVSNLGLIQHEPANDSTETKVEGGREQLAVGKGLRSNLSRTLLAKPKIRTVTGELEAQVRTPQTTSGLPTRLVVIGGSTGAPAAVTKLLQQLPADFPLPIAIALHMLEDFTVRLAQSLDRAAKLRCKEASHNELLQPGLVYIAKGDHHLTIEKNDQGRFVCHLNKESPEHFARPSVNQLFRSAANAAGPGALAVILTGIGCDGLEGTELLVRRGALVIAQDEASSTVWGMPAAVIQAGYAKHILDPRDAGLFIARKVAVEAMRNRPIDARPQ